MAYWQCRECGADVSGPDEIVNHMRDWHVCKSYEGKTVVHEE